MSIHQYAEKKGSSFPGKSEISQITFTPFPVMRQEIKKAIQFRPFLKIFDQYINKGSRIHHSGIIGFLDKNRSFS